jgi:hypothetical protein
MAVVAKMEGNHEVAVKLEENAKVHNDKANLLNVAQEHQLNALEEQRQGNVAKAEELKKQAKAIIKQVRNIPLPHIIRNNYGLIPVSDTESETEKHEPLVYNAHITTLSGYEIGNYAHENLVEKYFTKATFINTIINKKDKSNINSSEIHSIIYKTVDEATLNHL